MYKIQDTKQRTIDVILFVYNWRSEDVSAKFLKEYDLKISITMTQNFWKVSVYYFPNIFFVLDSDYLEI